MKTGGSVITYYWNDQGKPKGWRDKVVYNLRKDEKIKIKDGWTIEDQSKKVVGSFYTILGPKPLVDFLSWLTNINPASWFVSKKNRTLEKVIIDEHGNISEIQKV